MGAVSGGDDPEIGVHLLLPFVSDSLGRLIQRWLLAFNLSSASKAIRQLLQWEDEKQLCDPGQNSARWLRYRPCFPAAVWGDSCYGTRSSDRSTVGFIFWVDTLRIERGEDTDISADLQSRD
jgi:hypothetical protein